jgi:predicted N-formylglutamate amidohydrolase
MPGEADVEIENAGATGPWLIVCEHASNVFPSPWGELGLGAEAREAHIAWDPGALALARGLAARLDAPLVAARVSRLIYDQNRPPDAPGAMAARSELWDVPGNRGLTAQARQARVASVYLPFHAALGGQVARMLAGGLHPALVTVHSFTPLWYGQPREVECGVIHDTDPMLARAVLAAARRRTGLRAELNAPYSAADGVTHTLKLHATPHGLPHAMLEIRNDLLASPSAAAAMADTLAPVLAEARASVQREEQGVA